MRRLQRAHATRATPPLSALADGDSEPEILVGPDDAPLDARPATLPAAHAHARRHPSRRAMQRRRCGRTCIVLVVALVLAAVLLAVAGVALTRRTVRGLRFSNPISSLSDVATTRRPPALALDKPGPPWQSWRLPVHSDCKWWSIGVGFAHSPLSRIENWTRIFGPEHQLHRDAHGPWQLAADPFVVRARGKWYMFYEFFGANTKGRIGYATQSFGNETSPWIDGGEVSGLVGSHMSYPNVVYSEQTACHYMLPQITNQFLVLYESCNSSFPKSWVPVYTVDNTTTQYYDSNIVEWQGHWYIFGGLFDRSKQHTSKQVLYVSSNGPRGPYTPHPGAPLPMMRPDHFGRNGGRITRFNGTGLVRFTQYYVKGDSRYGEIVRAALITKLTPYEVEETYNVSWVASLPSEMWPEAATTKPSRWNAQGAHHVDMQPMADGRYMAFFDGRESCRDTKARPVHTAGLIRDKKRKEVHTPPRTDHAATRGAAVVGRNGTAVARNTTTGDSNPGAAAREPARNVIRASAAGFQADLAAQVDPAVAASRMAHQKHWQRVTGAAA